jgi:hypothetical protein
MVEMVQQQQQAADSLEAIGQLEAEEAAGVVMVEKAEWVM